MPRDGSVYRCQTCGYASPKPGTCADCARQGNYQPLVEERSARREAKRPSFAQTSPPVLLSDIRLDSEARTLTGIGELDRVLGGGVVRGSLVLIGGDPGIGKSTLLLQASRVLAELGAAVLYVSGEESVAQVKLRAERLGISPSGLYVLAETDLEAIEAHVEGLRPKVLVVDSIQTVYLADLESAPGSVSQVRECGSRLMLLAKGKGVA
ncbi:MAG: AAA family ATPase, partial [Candidatus Rokubacteria bacterium]|nr:AAA family ATPase [Candidatus Rokubacteria bacterium]